MATTVATTGRRWGRAALPLAVLLAVFAVYLPGVANGFIYDDAKLIVRHDGIHSVGDLAQLFREPHFPRFPYYRPITRTTLLLQKTLHGNDPAPFHLVNAALMAATALVAAWVLAAPMLRVPRRLALLAGAGFALHPLAAHCVHPICSGRETLIPGLVMLGAIGAWLRPGRGLRLLAWALFAVALFCKEQAIVLPLLFGLADLCRLPPDAPGRPWTELRRWLSRYWPALPIAAGYFAARHAALGGTGIQAQPGLGVLGPFWSLIYALQVTFVPFEQLVYEPPREVWWSWWRLLLAVTGVALLVRAAWRTLRPRGLLLFAGGWFLIVQLPTMNFIRQEVSFADRYVWLASFGVFLLAAATLGAWFERPTARRVITAGALVALVGWSAISAALAAPHHDDVAFAQQWLRTNPDAYEAHFTLGVALEQSGAEPDAQAARAHYEAALRVKPDFVDAHVNLARLLRKSGQREAAHDHFAAALTLRPDDVNALVGSGQLLLDEGRLADGEAVLARAASLDPSNAEALNNHGVALARLERVDEALARFDAALRLRPDFLEAHVNAAMALQKLGRNDEMKRRLEEALTLARRAGSEALVRELEAWLARLASRPAGGR